MTKLDGRSLALGAERLKALQELVPEAFADGKIDLEALRSMLEDLAISPKEESYRFTWAGKAKTRYNAHQGTDLTLRPCPEESLDWDSTGNLYIEGDNLEALKILLKSYQGAVKMIYIDPPYNTGKDFVYKDDYRQSLKGYEMETGQRNSGGHKVAVGDNSKDQAHYHTDWLNMIYPRLVVARKLLSEDGVIFISIDDNEVHNLRKICDEVFGADNFVAELIWKSKSGGANDSLYTAVDHEYILAYASNIEKLVIMEDKDATVTTNYAYKDEKGAYSLERLDKQSLGYQESLDYPITGPDGKIYQVQHKNPNAKVARWRWGKETVQERYDELVFKNGCVYTKNYQKEGSIPRSLLMEERFGRTRTGKTDLTSLFEGVAYFPTPKPCRLIGYLLKIAADSEALILDFFSGSGTTAQAVMQLNAEDGGKRKYICVQLDEEITDKTTEGKAALEAGYKTICEIGKERIRRAGRKVKEEAGEAAQDLDTGFRVFKVDTSAVRQWEDPTRRFASELEGLEGTPAYAERLEALVERSLREELFPLREGREGDLVYELLLQFGLPLDCPIEYLRTKSGRELCLIAGGATTCAASTCS